MFGSPCLNKQKVAFCLMRGQRAFVREAKMHMDVYLNRQMFFHDWIYRRISSGVFRIYRPGKELPGEAFIKSSAGY
jgi:hypothetical protein